MDPQVAVNNRRLMQLTEEMIRLIKEGKIDPAVNVSIGLIFFNQGTSMVCVAGRKVTIEHGVRLARQYIAVGHDMLDNMAKAMDDRDGTSEVQINKEKGEKNG